MGRYLKPNGQAGKQGGLKGKETTKHKQVHKEQPHKDHTNKDKRDRSAEPERKMSKPIVETKAPNLTSSTMLASKPKAEVKKPAGPVDSAKVGEIKERLVELENLINTYDEVEMDKEINLKSLI